jgi:hypothetical protein
MNELLELGRQYSIQSLFDIARKGLSPTFYFDVYGSESDHVNRDMLIWVDEPIEVDDDDSEIYPPLVQAKNLAFLYSSEMIRMVCQNLLRQKPDANADDFAAALDWYSKNDDFLKVV